MSEKSWESDASLKSAGETDLIVEEDTAKLDLDKAVMMVHMQTWNAHIHVFIQESVFGTVLKLS